MEIVILFLILVGIVAYYFYLVRNYNYWRDRGIPCARDVLPGFGHMWPVVSLKMSMHDLIRCIYDSHPNCSMVGLYDKTVPALVVREPELVKTVMQTNFASFAENQLKLDSQLDPLLSLNPFFTAGNVWITSRKRFTHAFSGMRLKLLFDCVERVCEKFENYLDRKLKSGALEVELKDLFSRYTGEVVADAAFGVEGFCFEDDIRRESFLTIGRSIFEPSFLSKIVQTLNFFLPQFNRIFQMPFLPKEADRFFRDIVKQVLQHRQRESVRRNDFFQLMMDLEKSANNHYDEEVLASHALGFFFDGYETSSITMSFIGYQLARHPQIVQKLRDEVESVLARYDNQLTYESLKEMTYMDQVINESQRLYSALAIFGKICTEEIELKGSDGLSCRVRPGTLILMSVDGLHRDPKYWREPHIFDPDRFAADKKAEITKYTFLPFGEGPRICVGMRMGLLQMKACLATLVRKYTLELSPKTKEPLKMLPGSFLTAPVGGLWVNIKRL
ncbi:cytochrome P450 6j1-like [Linepithema humile]|uniref:cytochrome P450 6j1-like n=1 Tax=Linepithema humile TaxID=83485 RepID=UPI000623A199|nr:PREDICTED: cytochrome P450 6j1-like [Linepithema humile]